MEKHFKNIKRILAYVLFSFLITSCSSELDGVFTWDSFIKKASSDGSTFFAEATAPSGVISFGGSDDSQWSANSKAVRHCSEKSREICRLTRTTTLPKKQNIEILECTEKYSRDLKTENLGQIIMNWCSNLVFSSSKNDKQIAECSLKHISQSKNITNATSGARLCEAKYN